MISGWFDLFFTWFIVLPLAFFTAMVLHDYFNPHNS